MLIPKTIQKADHIPDICNSARITPNTTKPIAEPNVIFTSSPNITSSIIGYSL